MQVSLANANGQNRCSFYPFSGVTEELKTYIHAISTEAMSRIISTLKFVSSFMTLKCKIQ